MLICTMRVFISEPQNQVLLVLKKKTQELAVVIKKGGSGQVNCSNPNKFCSSQKIKLW